MTSPKSLCLDARSRNAGVHWLLFFSAHPFLCKKDSASDGKGFLQAVTATFQQQLLLSSLEVPGFHMRVCK